MTTSGGPDPVLVHRTIQQLSALSDDKQFAEALADNIMDPMPEETAAFRSDELAVRSLAAAKFLIDNVNSTIKKKEGESDAGWRHRAEHYRSRVGMERRLLNDVVTGIYARQGRTNNSPNPVRRAKERLWSLVMAGQPVDREVQRRLVEEERRRDEERRKAERERRKAEKRAARAAARS